MPPATAANWYSGRDHNGHPGPVLAVGRRLYFDEVTLLAWVRAQLDPAAAPPRIVRGGRTLVTRSELARLTGLSEATLAHIYADRAVTGYPEVVHRDRRALYFDERAGLAWHAGRTVPGRRGRGPGTHPPSGRRLPG